jgi:hypothetical protein
VIYCAGLTPTTAALGGPPTEAGTNPAVVSFPSSTDFAAASSRPDTFTFAPALKTLTLESSAGSVVSGQPVTLTANSPEAGTPTGEVPSLDGTATVSVARSTPTAGRRLRAERPHDRGGLQRLRPPSRVLVPRSPGRHPDRPGAARGTEAEGEACRDRIRETFQRAGFEAERGSRRFSVSLRAGLPLHEMQMQVGSGAAAYELAAATVSAAS